MIQAIDLTKLRNPEYIQFQKQFLEIVALNNPSILKVQQEFDASDAVLKDIEALFKTDQGSPITPVIEALDARRDMAVMGIYKQVDSYLGHFTEVKKEAANTLMSQFNVYGNASNVTLASLQAETAIVTSLVTDLTTKPNLVAAVDELGFAPWVDELKTANDLLNQKYIDRTVELGAANPNTIKDKRIASNELYYLLRDMLVSQATVQRNIEPYPTTTNQLNALIDQYNTLLVGRTSSGGATANATAETPAASS
jgi:Family of unknown function (DUF6261)